MRLATLQPQHHVIGFKRGKVVDNLSTFLSVVMSFKQIELLQLNRSMKILMKRY